MLDIESTAALILKRYDQVTPVQSHELADLTTTDQAAAVVEKIAAMRVARGERRRGYKIGFTNRTIWERYGVNHPIWAPIYDTTVDDLARFDHRIAIAGLLEPRLEPEIVIGLAHAPERAETEAVAQAIAWVAHGFEVVQSPFAGWQFTGAHSFAVQGLHGRLLIGPRVASSCLASDHTKLAGLLTGLRLTLTLNDGATPVDQGTGANVLDGPCQAIVHLMQELARRGTQLAAGDIITTGTITDAQPLVAGQHWRSTIDGVPGLLGLHAEVVE